MAVPGPWLVVWRMPGVLRGVVFVYVCVGSRAAFLLAPVGCLLYVRVAKTPYFVSSVRFR